MQFLEQSGQFHSAHDTVCKDFPAHEIGVETAPLLMATHVLLRYREPVPHVLVQSLHELHRDHLDSLLGKRFAITVGSATLLNGCTSLVDDIIEETLALIFFELSDTMLDSEGV